MFYRHSLAVVVPSIYETFPMVFVEPIACGKPVVASNINGIRLLVQHVKSGLLFEPRDANGQESMNRCCRVYPHLERAFPSAMEPKELTSP